jgi:hypothetical protein
MESIQQIVRALVEAHPAYRLSAFREILAEMLKAVGGVEGLADKHILELGPGRRLDLLRFLAAETRAASVRGIGKTPRPPRPRPDGSGNRVVVENAYLLPSLRGLRPATIDIVYSRYVMEQHSINPWVLLTSRVYWRYFRENRFRRPGEDYPSSKPNLQAVFREACRVLKPGGIIISQMAKKRYSVLDGDFLDSCRLSRSSRRELGKLSLIVTVVK